MEKIITERLNVSRESPYIEIIFQEEIKTFWDDLCKAFREACKNHQNYHISIDNGGVNGRSDDGTVIVINSLGKWLFGTPGYKGHIIYESVRKGTIRIYYPSEAPKEVVEMLKSTTEKIIIQNCHFWGNAEYELFWNV